MNQHIHERISNTLCTFFIDFELMNSAYSHEQAIMLELYSSKSYAYICHINMVG